MELELRDYQLQASAALLGAVAEGVKRPAVVLPTGAGKTVVFAHAAERLADRGLRPVVLVHRDELARQAARTLRRNIGKPVGIVQGPQDEYDHPYVVASVQTLARSRRRDRLTGPDTAVIVDECHHAAARSYRNVLEHFGCFDGESPGVALGVTATMSRGDGAALGKIWEKIVYQRDVPWMIRHGWLTDVSGIRLRVEDLDLTGVRRTAGDLDDGDVGEALLASSSPTRVAEKYDELCRSADGRPKPGILFAPTVETAGLFADALSDRGIRVAVVHGAMPQQERRRILAGYEAGLIDVLCNCMVLTEGFDSPRAQVCVIARPTMSASLYVQMVGRVLRLHPGKERALVLDVVGSSALHALSTLATLSGREMVVREGETLLEAIDAEGAKVPKRPSVYSDERLIAEEVDLFHDSRFAWRRTDCGWWFISTGDRYVIVGKDNGVLWLSAHGAGGGWVARDVPDFATAKALAEDDVDPSEYMASRARGPQRKRLASGKTLAWAQRLGIDVADLPDTRAGTVGDAITGVLASRRIDTAMVRYTCQ